MSKQILNIWNRDFEIDITYEIFSDKPITEKQKAIASGLATVDFSGSLDEVIKYIKKYNNYKFDMEHGIAVVYRGGKYKEAGPQDIIL